MILLPAERVYSTGQSGLLIGSPVGSNYLTGDLADVYFDEAHSLICPSRPICRNSLAAAIPSISARTAQHQPAPSR